MSNPSTDVRPEHRVHDSSEPLPGAGGARPPANYDTSATQHKVAAKGWDDPEHSLWREVPTDPKTNSSAPRTRSAQKNNSDYALDSQAAKKGGPEFDMPEII